VAKIDRLFDELIARGASDLHLGIGYPPMLRTRGELVPMRDAPVDKAEMDALLFEITTPAQKSKIDGEHDLDFAYGYEGKARFRANYFLKATGLAAVFRIVPTKVATLAELGCPDVFRKLAERRSGLVLLTGPTGCGKSTTLAAMIDHINETRACHVLTIEDPIEFVHEPKRAAITHREVGVHAPSFAAAMRSAGREDPQVILVGELRTSETMLLALQLANQGILVLATVHTNGAAATIDRVINAFGAAEQSQVRGMLAEGLVAVVAQQLLRTRDGAGRVAAHEILVGSGAVSAMIRDGKMHQIGSVMQGGQGMGMQTMDMALERLLAQGRIAPEAALDVAIDKEAFAKVVARTRPDLFDPNQSFGPA
jgi:twitching motility protein PilT